MGGLAATRDFYRFFIAPGMGHCAGGPGPNQFDAIGALEQWVEKGMAPDKLIATHSTNGKVDRTRPLCMYPLVARYKGTGSIDEAANFACVAAPAAGAGGEDDDVQEDSDEARLDAKPPAIACLRARRIAVTTAALSPRNRRPASCEALERSQAAGHHYHHGGSRGRRTVQAERQRDRAGDDGARLLPRRRDAQADAGVEHQDRSLAAAGGNVERQVPRHRQRRRRRRHQLSGARQRSRRGYATTNTDMGTTHDRARLHASASAIREMVVDWGYRATHLMTQVAKQVAKSYYKRDPQQSYFMGCSTGGHQALTEARRYPEDYNGIVAGDPANNRVRLHMVGLLELPGHTQRSGQLHPDHQAADDQPRGRSTPATRSTAWATRSSTTRESANSIRRTLHCKGC